MTNDTEVEVPRFRLNPFIFPSATTIRFILLIIAIIGITLSVYSAVYTDYLENQGILKEIKEQSIECSSKLEAFSSVLRKSVESSNSSLISFHNIAWNQCMEPFNQKTRESAWFALGVVATLLSISGIVCSLLPSLMIRWERMVVFETQPDLEDVFVYLKKLCQQIELTHPPKFLLKPTSRAIGGKVFGFWKRYYFVLPTGLIILFDQDRETFRTVIFHELAHLKNRDIDRTYFSIVASFIFIIAILFPIPFTWRGDYFYISWRIITFSLLIYLVMTATVRSREFYADIRASVYFSSEAFSRLLTTSPQRKCSNWQSILTLLLERLPCFTHNRWQLAFQFHPTSSERCQVLKCPERLFYFNFWEAVSIGMAIAAAFNSILLLIVPVLKSFIGQADSISDLSIAALVFSPLIAGVVGMGVWREAYVSLIENASYASAGRLGLGLGLGLILGQVLSPYSTAEITIISIWHHSLISILWNLIWSILLLVCFYYFFKWVATGASAWLKIVIISRAPRSFYITGLIVTGIFLVFLFSVISYAQVIVQSITPESIGDVFLDLILVILLGSAYVTYLPVTSIAFIFLWAFPLSSWFWQKHLNNSIPLSSWIFLDEPTHQIYLPTQKMIQLRPALISGLKGGGLYCGLLLSIRLLLRLALSESVRETASFKLILFYVGFIGLAAFIQAVIALKITRDIKYLSIIHGLFAAFVAACVMVLGAFVILVLFGGTLDLPFALMIFRLIVNWGASLSLLAVLFLSWLPPRTPKST